MNEYQDWVWGEWQEYGGDTLMEEMDHPDKWFDTDNGYFPELMGAE